MSGGAKAGSSVAGNQFQFFDKEEDVNIKMPIKLLISFASAVFCGSLFAQQPPPVPFPVLVYYIGERIALAEQVALSKWDTGKPVEDRVREAQVMEGVVRAARMYGLERYHAMQFFSAQVEANKLVQYGLLAEWRDLGNAPDTPRSDLVNDIRPRINALQMRLLLALKDIQPYRGDAQCQQWLAQSWQPLGLDALHQLALVRATGTLCRTQR